MLISCILLPHKVQIVWQRQMWVQRPRKWIHFDLDCNCKFTLGEPVKNNSESLMMESPHPENKAKKEWWDGCLFLEAVSVGSRSAVWEQALQPCENVASSDRRERLPAGSVRGNPPECLREELLGRKKHRKLGLPAKTSSKKWGKMLKIEQKSDNAETHHYNLLQCNKSMKTFEMQICFKAILDPVNKSFQF